MNVDALPKTYTTIYKLVVHEGSFSKNYNDLFVTYKISILASYFKNQKLVENIYTILLLDLCSEEKKMHTFQILDEQAKIHQTSNIPQS